MSTADQPSVEVTGDEDVASATSSGGGTSSGPGARGVLRSVGRNALARMVVLPISAALGLIVTRLVIGEYGQGAYAQYALLVGIGALLPFADLGMSAAVINATASARDPRADQRLRLMLVSCLRVLSGSATVVVLLSIVITASGWWDNLLGSGLLAGSGSRAAGLCLGVVGVTLTVSFGERILAGLGKYQLVVLLNGLQTPIVLSVLLVSIKFDLGTGGYIAVIAYLATFLISSLTLILANRWISPTLSGAMRDAPRLRAVRGARFMDTAWPMLVQMIALPIAMQTDRIVLSHVSTLDQLAEFSLAAQMFYPAVGVVATAGMALWPVFAKARAEGVRSAVSPVRMASLFGGVAVVMAGMIALASGFLSDLASGGTISLSGPLVAAFCCFLVVQAVKYPLGMYMTDAPGLRYQAYMILMMLPVNVGISWVLAERIGAPGPVIGSVIGVAMFQVLPNWAYVRRHRSHAG